MWSSRIPRAIVQFVKYSKYRGLAAGATATTGLLSASYLENDRRCKLAIAKRLRSEQIEAKYKSLRLATKPHSKMESIVQYAKSVWDQIVRAVRISARFLYLFALFFPMYLTRDCSDTTIDELRSWWWRQLRDRLIRSGPCFTKFAQWLSTNHGLLSDDAIQYLSMLHNHTHVAVTSKNLEAMLNEEFPDWRQYLSVCKADALDKKDGTISTPAATDVAPARYATISPHAAAHIKGPTDLIPIGSGCVAQVVKGTWKDGNPVAIKLIRPNVRTTVLDDIVILKFMYKRIFKQLVPHARSIDGSLEEFSSMMLGQLNLFAEGENLRKFRRNFDSDHWEYQQKFRRWEDPILSFPEPLFPFVSETMLVQTYSEGRTLANIFADENSVPSDVKQEIANIGLQAVLKMIFEDNFVHIDLHPENIIIDYSADKPTRRDPHSEPRLKTVHFIDAGIVTPLSGGDFINLLSVSQAVLFNNPDKFARLIVEGAPDKYCASFVGFRRSIEKILDSLHNEPDFSKKHVVTLTQQFLQACARFEVKLEPRLVYLVVGMALLQGVGVQLHPDINLLYAVMPYIVTAGGRYLTAKDRWYLSLFSSEKAIDILM